MEITIAFLRSMHNGRSIWCSKFSLFGRPQLNEKPMFSKISTLLSVLEKMHFPWPFSPDTCGQSAKPVINLPFHQKTANMCGRGELMWIMVLQRLILCLVRLLTLQQSLHTSQLLRCPSWRGNCSIPGARFSNVPIINAPGKLSRLPWKIQVSIVLHLAW